MAIIGAAMMPIFTLERVEGRIFRPVALTYGFALAGALVFTLTTVPALTATLLKRRKVREVEPGFLRYLREKYLTALRWTFRRPGLTALGGIPFLVLAGLLV